jgi:hypothetical protein
MMTGQWQTTCDLQCWHFSAIRQLILIVVWIQSCTNVKSIFVVASSVACIITVKHPYDTPIQGFFFIFAVKLSWLHRIIQWSKISPHSSTVWIWNKIFSYFNSIFIQFCSLSEFWLLLYRPWLTFGFFIKKKTWNFIHLVARELFWPKTEILQRTFQMYVM